MTAFGRTTDDWSSDFPVGMRVLAVDDDPASLMILDTLLRRCQYNVTTTNHAVTALKILRENKDMFDLVISDVHMPDMDGFKLLELVKFEMDLPVIMLSAYGDTEYVMKGITHGVCDYLLKPVRVEELRNIWQHVVRKKRIDDAKNQKFIDKPHGYLFEVGQGVTGAGETDQNDKITRKRKDQNEDEHEELDKDGDDINEDASMQKRTRLVWSDELHYIFVAAVNQLGIDRAVPKRILELMNVEGVTRGNVASHLQKYRTHLKKISEGGRHQARIQQDHAQNLTNAVTGVTNFQSRTQPENQIWNILQGMPPSLGLDQVQLNQMHMGTNPHAQLADRGTDLHY